MKEKQTKLFDTDEYVDRKLLEIMDKGTCGNCKKKITTHQRKQKKTYCSKRKSGRTETGYLRVRANQPACIWYKRIKTKK